MASINIAPTRTKDDVNIVEEVWRIMLGVDKISHKDLVAKISAHTGMSHAVCHYVIKLMEKPIQTELEYEYGQEQPTATFVEPLLVRVPCIEKQSYYALVSYWRNLVKSGSELFDKAKRFY